MVPPPDAQGLSPLSSQAKEPTSALTRKGLQHQHSAPKAGAFGSKCHFTFSSVFTCRPICKTQTPECCFSELCLHPLTPTHAADAWASLDHDRTQRRLRGGSPGGALPRATRRSRTLGLFWVPCRGRGLVLSTPLHSPAGRALGPQGHRDRAPAGPSWPPLSAPRSLVSLQSPLHQTPR